LDPLEVKSLKVKVLTAAETGRTNAVKKKSVNKKVTSITDCIHLVIIIIITVLGFFGRIMNTSNLQELLTKFITSNNKKVDTLALRKYVFDELSRIYAWCEYLLHNPEYTDRWRNLKDYIQSHDGRFEQEKWKNAVNEIVTLDSQIQGWIDEHVDSDERIEFSIATKAAEISSGNEVYDYYYALMVRHDQLLACVEIFRQASEGLAQLAKMSDVGEMVDSSAFGFFVEKTISQHIYETAKIMYKMREE